MRKQYIIIFLILFLTVLCSVHTFAYFCYQESANVSNQTGIDESCGLQYTGKYTISGGDFFINYTKPVLSYPYFLSGAVLHIKTGTSPERNITIPNSCYSYYNNSIYLYIISNYYLGAYSAVNVYCYKGSWEVLSTSSIAGTGGYVLNYTIPTFWYDGDWNTYLAHDNSAYNVYGTVYGNFLNAAVYEEGIFWEISQDINTLKFYDEISNNLITQPINISITSNTIPFQTNYSTTTGILNTSNLSPDNYTITLSSTNPTAYTTRSYQININNISSNYSFYLAYASDLTLNYYDISNRKGIENVLVQMQRVINNEWVTVESRLTNTNGNVVLSYLDDTQYRFVATVVNYTSYTFTLNPVTETSLAIPLSRSTNNNPDFTDVIISHSPQTYYAGKSNTFVWSINSPSGLLSNYGYNVFYPCGFITFNGNNATGESNSTAFTNCGSKGDYINITWDYTTASGVFRNFSIQYPMEAEPVNLTILSINKNGGTYGLADLDRVLITTVLIIIIGGVGGLLGGMTIAVLLALFTLAFLTWSGFVPIYFIIVTLIVGVFYLIGRRDLYG